MILERYLTDVLTRHLGHWVEDFDPLKVSAWKGTVLLQNLQLKPQSFLIYGHVGHLEMQIPWKLLKEEFLFPSNKKKRKEDTTETLVPNNKLPKDGLEITLVLSNVNLLLAPPNQDEETDHDRNNPQFDDSKESRVQQALLDTLLKRSTSTATTDHTNQKDSLLSKILSRLRVQVQNIHVRYEDDGAFLRTSHRSTMAIGLTLQHFTIQSQSQNMAAHQLALYWDSDTKLMLENYYRNPHSESNAVFEQAFQLLNETGMALPQGAFSSRHSYILDPFSPSLHIALANETNSTSSLTAELPPCRFHLSRQLLDDTVYLRQSLALVRSRRIRHHPHSDRRPRASPTQDPRGWWKYAYRSVVLPRCTWKTLIRALVQRQRYTELYRIFLRDQDAQYAHEQLLQFEEILTVREIVAFRIHALSRLDDTVMILPEDTPDETNNDVMSASYRRKMAFEIMSAVMENQKNTLNSAMTGENDGKRSLWETTLSCPELSLQLNDRSSAIHRSSSKKFTPVVRLSCSFLAKQRIQSDRSWDLEANLGSLTARDLTVNGLQNDTSRPFHTLVGAKEHNVSQEDRFTISHQSHVRNAWLRIQSVPLVQDETEIYSKMNLKLKVLPLEIIYATKPVEALSRIFGTSNTELAFDYRTLAGRLSMWRERQKAKLLATLSRKDRRLLVDISIGAPRFLLPEGESSSSSLLFIDLGRLSFSNKPNLTVEDYDDAWALDIRDITVTKTDISSYIDESEPTFDVIVEPFSLDFEIFSKVQRDETDIEAMESSTLIRATLPHLEFNLTASAVRLVRRLQKKWQERKLQIKPQSMQYRLPYVFRSEESQDPSRILLKKRRSKSLEFYFHAPLLLFRVENDLNMKRCVSGSPVAVPIVDIVLKGWEGRYSTERVQGGETMSSLASRIRSLQATDRYQQAGNNFMFLLSSLQPDVVLQDNEDRGAQNDLERRDLVRIEFESTSNISVPGAVGSKTVPAKLAIQFFELYVEWNPETIAALSDCCSLDHRDEDTDRVSNEDEFFDAEEESFHDAFSVESSDEESTPISEVSSRQSSFSDLVGFSTGAHFPALYQGPLVSRMTGASTASAFPLLGSPSRLVDLSKNTTMPPKFSFEVSFKLSRLRVRFNKETRHRRVVVAEVETTSVIHHSNRLGGSSTVAELGNLTVWDPSFNQNQTLYKEIIGLKPSLTGKKEVSLLSMTITRNIRSRGYGKFPGKSPDRDNSVHVDFDAGRIYGCDTHVQAQFSPMRFVYIQQLWFEIIDYFFEGILGYDVWAGKRPTAAILAETLAYSKDPEKISVTRFDFSFEAPVILLPVTYLSTDHLKIEAGSIHLSNFYDLKPMRVDSQSDSFSEGIEQWFNNAEIGLSNLVLKNASGGELTRSGSDLHCTASLNWPTGPSSPLNIPKWNVAVTFSEMKLNLQKEDYALLQNFIAKNLSADSRHLYEWYALKSLSGEEEENFYAAQFVLFNYDKKDATPTTFNVSIASPSISFAFRSSVGKEICVALCSEVKWNYVKLEDRVPRQSVDALVEIRQPLLMGGSSILSGTEGILSRLIYSSVTQVSGDNERRLTLGHASVLSALPFWSKVSNFFTSLPEPQYSHPSNVIQVGDRWYKIAEGPPPTSLKEKKVLRWIPGGPIEVDLHDVVVPPSIHVPTYTFIFSIDMSEILIGKKEVCVISIPELKYIHVGHRGRIHRTVQLDGLKCGFRNVRSNHLIFDSLFLSGSFHGCTGRTPCVCDEHETRICLRDSSGCIAFSDILRMLYLQDEINEEVRGINSEPRTVRQRSDIRSPSPESGSTIRSSLPTKLKFESPGINYMILDDTGRHFAGDQNIIRVSWDDLSLEKSASLGLEESKLSINSLFVYDCLQRVVSPYHRILAATRSTGQMSTTESSRPRCAIELVIRKSPSQETVSVLVDCLKIQYNPSMIIAMQRYLGRLRKRIRQFHESREPAERLHGSALPYDFNRKDLKLHVEVADFNASLNKEHQGRSLLQVEFLSNSIDLSMGSLGTSAELRIAKVAIWDSDKYPNDSILTSNRDILRSLDENNKFLELSYYSGKKTGSSVEFPTWIQEKTRLEDSIDDYLRVRLGKLRMVHFSSRMRELVDYLGNGLPGRGMGATSQAAKGFVKDRIMRKSYFDLDLETFCVRVPHRESLHESLEFNFGKTGVRSWVEIDEGARYLTFEQSGGSIVSNGVSQGMTSEIARGLSQSVSFCSAENQITIGFQLSTINIDLHYTTYRLLTSIFKDNISRPVNKESWDNLEAQWEKETHVHSMADGEIQSNHEVVYADDARIIRYGAKRTKSGSKKLNVECRIPQFAFHLIRDDGLTSREPIYGVVSAGISDVEFTFFSSGTETHAMLSIQRVLVKDTGNKHRHMLKKAPSKRLPSPFFVIVDGYRCDELESGDRESLDDSPHVLVTYDGSQVLQTERKISLVVNRISFSFLTEPLKETYEFLSLVWSAGTELPRAESQESVGRSYGERVPGNSTPMNPDRIPKYHVEWRLVFHYPRFIVLADEHDSHSKALVLRGLAILSGEQYPQSSDPSSNPLVTLRADLQNVSSHMYFDVSRDLFSSHLSQELIELGDGPDSSVPLLLPLTLNAEVEEYPMEDSGKRRVVSLFVEPVSLIISQEDFNLIQVFIRKLKSSTSTQSPDDHLVKVTFETPTLGLGLRGVGGYVVVDSSVTDNVLIGDTLRSINSFSVTEGTPLSAVVHMLQNEARPLVLEFSRKNPSVSSSNEPIHPAEKPAFVLDFDLSISEASLSYMAAEVPLFRGYLTGTRFRYQSEPRRISASTSSTFSIAYYNIRIWDWEPLVESSFIASSLRRTESEEGIKNIEIELTDNGVGPLQLNVTDASAFALGRLLGDESSATVETIRIDDFFENQSQERNGVPSRNTLAADVAFQFAQRQREEGDKPFYFSNKTGLSCAFGISDREKNQRDPSMEFLTVGEYGLLEYDQISSLTEVASNEMVKFSVVMGHDRALISSGSPKLLPTLTVALQAMSWVKLQPLENLELLPGQYIVPLRFSPSDDRVQTHRLPISWSVESLEAKTSVVLGGTVRVIANVEGGIEVAFSSGDGPESEFHSLGNVHYGEEFFVPLWVLLKGNGRLLVRPNDKYRFSVVTDLPFDQIKSLETLQIECSPSENRTRSVFLTVGFSFENEFLFISVDCSVFLRNTLPIDIGWQLENVLSGECIDGSSLRKVDLKSGSYSEVFCGSFEDLRLRLCVSEWTNWISLVQFLDDKTSIEKVLVAKDPFGVPENVGFRVDKVSTRLEITVFAELWLVNTTKVPLSFGIRAMDVVPFVDEQSITDITPAEAALQEISSMFEGGDGAVVTGKPLVYRASRDNDFFAVPNQMGLVVTESCYEYVEVHHDVIKATWWASDNPYFRRKNPTSIQGNGRGWVWIDSEWLVSTSSSSQTQEGWESSPRIDPFVVGGYDHGHRYRRRKWVRRRSCEDASINAFVHRKEPRIWSDKKQRKGSFERDGIHLGYRVDGGPWSPVAAIPDYGTGYGAVRVLDISHEDGWKNGSESIYEFCHSVVPMNGELGSLTRLMVISPRFLIRNDSKDFAFDVKQSGSKDSTSIRIRKGQTEAFHWADSKLPELISIRMVSISDSSIKYRWSGGFDPLNIGALPLRQRTYHFGLNKMDQDSNPRSVKVEVSIRPKSGDLGINIGLIEEDTLGNNSLFRIENESPFPIWTIQDGLYADPNSSGKEATDGDVVLPKQKIPFALDVPFRQGKYSHRKAATVEELLHVRLGLGPLTSRIGIETTKVIQIASIGESVNLNPSKMSILDPGVRREISSVRVLGVVTSDGPTNVLKFRLIGGYEKMFSNPFRDEILSLNLNNVDSSGIFRNEILLAVESSIALKKKDALPPRDRALKEMQEESYSRPPEFLLSDGDNLSIRMSFSGLILSLVDECPAEIALISVKNVNVLGSWNTKRTSDSTLYITVTDLQIDNMVPNAPYGVAVSRDESIEDTESEIDSENRVLSPLLVIGVAIAPQHQSGVLCVNSVTLAPRDMSIRVDLAFLVRLQKFFLDVAVHLSRLKVVDPWKADIEERIKEIQSAAYADVGSRKLYFRGLTILPCRVKLSVEPARALTVAQAKLEGEKIAAIHQAVRKGDVKIGGAQNSLLGVKIGHRNATPLAVMRGVFKSIVVDALLRLDGASLNFSGVSLQNHNTTTSQLRTQLVAHYLASLRQNLPSLLGSMSAFGNPLGLVRGLGDGVSDFVLEPVKGFQRSVQEMDASYLVDGVAKGTVSLARHTVGGFAGSAAALTETFSKNMTVLTLDRRYAQKRDRGENLRVQDDVNVALGLGSGVQKLVQGFLEGVTGVVKAPIRGAEKRGLEGFAKGVGKGLLGLLVKPIIGISDGITDVMIGVKGSVGSSDSGHRVSQIRPRRPLYGRERRLRPYIPEDAVAAALMQRTRLAGEQYLGHMEMKERLALLSVHRLLVIGRQGNEELLLKYQHIERLEIRQMNDEAARWSIVVVLNTPRRNGSEVEVIVCDDKSQAELLKKKLEDGINIVSND